MSFLRQLLSDRKRRALAGALCTAVVAGAVAIVPTIAGEEGAQSSNGQGTPRSRADTEAERSKRARRDSPEPRKRAEGPSQAGSGRTRSGGGDPRGARKLPRGFVKELRRRKIPVIELELEPGKGPGPTGPLKGGEQIDPRTLQKLLQQQQK